MSNADNTKVKFKEIKEAMKALNETGLIDKKLRYVGIKIDEATRSFIDAISNLKPEIIKDLDDDLINIFNALGGVLQTSNELDDMCGEFGKGYNEDDSDCKVCKKDFPEDYKRCKAIVTNKSCEKVSKNIKEEKDDIKEIVEETIDSVKGVKINKEIIKDLKIGNIKKEKEISKVKKITKNKTENKSKLKKQDYCHMAIKNLCINGATKKQLVDNADEIYRKNNGKAKSKPERIISLCLYALTKFNVLKNENNIYKFIDNGGITND